MTAYPSFILAGKGGNGSFAATWRVGQSDAFAPGGYNMFPPDICEKWCNLTLLFVKLAPNLWFPFTSQHSTLPNWFSPPDRELSQERSWSLWSQLQAPSPPSPPSSWSSTENTTSASLIGRHPVEPKREPSVKPFWYFLVLLGTLWYCDLIENHFLGIFNTLWYSSVLCGTCWYCDLIENHNLRIFDTLWSVLCGTCGTVLWYCDLIENHLLRLVDTDHRPLGNSRPPGNSYSSAFSLSSWVKASGEAQQTLISVRP